MKKVYLYDAEGYFAGEGWPQIDPLESQKAGREILIMPANSTELEPPEEKECFQIKWNGAVWEYEEILVEPEPEPEPYEPTEEELQARKRAERDARMSVTQDRIDRYRNQIEAGFAPTDDAETFKALLRYAQYLRNFTAAENWWTASVLFFEEWSEANG